MRAAARLRTISDHLSKSNNNIFAQSPCSTNEYLVKDKEFDYTLNNSCLTKDQRRFYEDNGYLVIRGLIDHSTLDPCRDHFIDLCDGACPPQGIYMMKEPSGIKAGAKGEHLYYKVQDILYDDVFSKYTESPELLRYVQCFTGPNITAIHSMLINKPPDAKDTSFHPLHQDLLYFALRPANLIVGTWTAMETVDTENGCLVVAPGSHTLGHLYTHGISNKTGPFKSFFGINNEQEMKTIPLCMEKGDTVFLHPLLVHGSGPNVSKRFRKAISCHYAASECAVVDLEGEDHQRITNLFESYASKMQGFKLNYKTLLRLKGVVVQGSEGFTALPT